MDEAPKVMERREFLLTGGLVAGGAAVAVGAVVAARMPSEPRDPVGPATARQLDTLKDLAPQEHEDVLVRMQRELVRAMAKPAEQRHWIMVIDLRKCVGCSACAIGCISENKLPPGVVYRPVTTEEIGTYPNIRLKFTPGPVCTATTPRACPCVP